MSARLSCAGCGRGWERREPGEMRAKTPVAAEEALPDVGEARVRPRVRRGQGFARKGLGEDAGPRCRRASSFTPDLHLIYT
jgi:hypothetical protein